MPNRLTGLAPFRGGVLQYSGMLNKLNFLFFYSGGTSGIKKKRSLFLGKKIMSYMD